MDIKTFNHEAQMLQLREELLAIEEERMASNIGVTLDELYSYLDDIIDKI